MIPPSTSSNQTTRPNSVGLPSLPLRMIAVCGSKMLTNFSLAPSCWPKSTRRVRQVIDQTTRRNEGLEYDPQPLPAGIRRCSECHLNLLGLPDYLRREANQAPVAGLQCLGSTFPASSCRVDQLFHHLLHTAAAVPEGRTVNLGSSRHDVFGSLDGPRQHPHTIAQQRAVDGIVDV